MLDWETNVQKAARHCPAIPTLKVYWPFLIRQRRNLAAAKFNIKNLRKRDPFQTGIFLGRQ